MQPDSKFIGQLSNQQGRTAEGRALRFIQDSKIPWVLSARLATPEEDARGVDIVVTSDIGPIYMQIKSSAGGARRFKHSAKHKHSTHIVVAVVNPRWSDHQARFEVTSALSKGYTDILNLRGEREN